MMKEKTVGTRLACGEKSAKSVKKQHLLDETRFLNGFFRTFSKNFSLSYPILRKAASWQGWAVPGETNDILPDWGYEILKNMVLPLQANEYKPGRRAAIAQNRKNLADVGNPISTESGNESSFYSNRPVAIPVQIDGLCRHAQDGLRDERCGLAAGTLRKKGAPSGEFSASVFPEAKAASRLAAVYLRRQPLRPERNKQIVLKDRIGETG